MKKILVAMIFVSLVAIFSIPGQSEARRSFWGGIFRGVVADSAYSWHKELSNGKYEVQSCTSINTEADWDRLASEACDGDYSIMHRENVRCPQGVGISGIIRCR